MRQAPSKPTTRYATVRRPAESDGYPQRIAMWEKVEELGSANGSELLTALRKTNYKRPNGAEVDEAYCRIELTDMTKRGFLKRIAD